MKPVLITSVVALMLCAPVMPQKKGAPKSKKPSPISLTAREIARRSLPSVVVLISRDTDGKAVTLSSGFFVTPRIIATNYHVISEASRATAKLLTGDKSEYAIDGSVAIDEDNDLALLQIGAGIEPGDDPYLAVLVPRGRPLSVAGGEIRNEIGDTVYVAGNPEGLEGTFSQGIISAFRGTDYIQITAPISPGSSGGPVINRFGEVIGIATLFHKEGQNLNFAVPVAKLFPLLANRSKLKPINPRDLAFDGLYGATFKTSNGDLVEWFRFHQDGSVFKTWANPRDNVAGIFDALSNGGNPYAYYGRYVLSGSNIEFVLNQGSSQDSSYRGIISQTTLRLTQRTIGGYETINQYGFVKVIR